ncbi:MAG: glycosyltransferase family 9 protein [Endomicrobium sp.]|uniref:glycosyltransferase family 9 protein n=1 Tax=Candidatus Endomicrobiellum pyrsonymphae TaxID=1408203 RepID=UPI00357A10AD|nr:glycosyltransferase family 9 protein [Endomicrobium sp.]
MKILIIKPSSFGDIVQALPCANALKQAYPKCEISWVVFNGWESLLKICLDVDKIISWNRKRGLKGFFEILKEVRKTKYDIIIDLQGLLRSAVLTRFATAKTKIGVPGMKEFSSFLIKEVYPKKANINATLRNLEPVRFLTGQLFNPEVNIKIESNAESILKDNKVFGDFLTLLPFARGDGKDWGVDNYCKLIDLVKNKYINIQIIVLGLKGDFGKIRSDRIVDLCGKTNIEDLAGILLKSKVAVGADTGSMHLSSILQTPSVFIFGASDINETSPYIGQFSLFVNEKNRDRINNIKSENVFAEIQKWIK